KTDDSILYAACFDANGGLFEPLLGEEDAIVSDELNHASIIDGVRMSKARRWRYRNNDMADLERYLKEAVAQGTRHRVIATDGVFSMDGVIADLASICDLADRYETEHCGVMGRVDLVTGTLGKALGGALGGFTTGRKEIVDLLRQRSRPYLFSNTLPPAVVGASIAVLDLLSSTTELRDRLESNTRFFREGLTQAGFDIKPGTHPIVPIMLYDEKLAHDLARRLLELRVYVVGFSFPVVPRGQARIRVQVSAAHERRHLEKALAAFAQAGQEFGVLKGAAR
ncbi:MAG: aminotransferase class I/II-fold pyridoxal phosphate-dependent enzyme, partial [Candidatus Eisenbacteria bacterium]